ncbi:MAG: VWA domain-containing protein [Planctomycetaceae bacterium]|nr:VWA domain-containing protein [Planctomycetaceae bacterium]
MTLFIGLILVTTACASIAVLAIVRRRKDRPRRRSSPVNIAILARRPKARRVDRRVVFGLCFSAFVVIVLERERLLDAWHDRDRGQVEESLDEREHAGDWQGAAAIIAARLELPLSADWRVRLERRRIYAQLEASSTLPPPIAVSLLNETKKATDRIGLPSQLPTALAECLRQEDRIRDLARTSVEQLANHAFRVADYPPVARRYWQDALQIAETYGLPTEAIATKLAGVASPRMLPRTVQLDVLSRRHSGVTWEFDLLVRDVNAKPVRGLAQTDFAVRSGKEAMTGWRVGEQRERAADHSIAVCLDCSNSTQGAPLALAKQGAWRLLDEVIDESPVALYAFGTKVTKAVDWNQNRKQSAAALQSLTTQGDTALLQVLHQAVEDLASRPGRRSLVVFTDGRDTVGGATWEQLSAETKRHGVSLFAVALQTADLDFEPLRTLAESTGGLAFVAEDRQLVNSFQTIAESLRVHFYRLVLLDDIVSSEALTITVGEPPVEVFVDLDRLQP